MRIPVIVVNFKAYPEALGGDGLGLALLCRKVAEETGTSIAVAPAIPDLARIAHEVKLPVLAQHFDAVQSGSRTGWIPIEAIQKAGAVGSLLNHSERKIPVGDLADSVRRCREVGIESLVCADTVQEARKVARLHPDYLAIEPPELIGGEISVTDARPEVVAGAVDAIQEIDRGIAVLCGAGVKSGKDVSKALELGTVGVLLSSGVVKARNQKRVLTDLARGLTSK